MPNVKSKRIPTYRRHKATGQARVTLNGKTHYLGAYGTAASREAYDRLVREWLNNGRALPPEGDEVTVNELILAYIRHAKTYYRQEGGVTSEVKSVTEAVRPLKALYGRTPVERFGPKALQAVRQSMIEKGWCRSYVNHQIKRIQRMFTWGISQEIVKDGDALKLLSVKGLRRGMMDLREAEPVRPVPEEFVRAALPYMPPAVSSMVQLQLLSGCRPGELCRMRGLDLNVSGEIWEYRPQYHKTAHLGHERVIYFGPKAQALLRPWLQTDLQAYIFSPAAAEESRNLERRRNRKTPMTPSQAKRRRKRNRARSWGERYTTASYARAIARACLKADKAAHDNDLTLAEDQEVVPAWSPNQLRHLRATQIRREYGLETAKTVLGHRVLETTQLYAEQDREKAKTIMSKIG